MTLRSNLNIKGLPMRYNKLGDSGLLVSELSFGCMTFVEGKTVADAYAELKLAYQSGVNFIDNSESYGETSKGWVRGGVSEVIMGQAVQLGIKEKLWERMDLVISTKLMWGARGTLDTPNSVGLSRKHLIEVSGLAQGDTALILRRVCPASHTFCVRVHLIRACTPRWNGCSSPTWTWSSATAQILAPRSGRPAAP